MFFRSKPAPPASPVDFTGLVPEIRSKLDDTMNEALSDRDCIRFLKARNGDIAKTEEMVRKWHEWYNKSLVEGKDLPPRDILVDFEDPLEDIYVRLLPHSNLGEDKNGNPIYWEKTGLISSRFQEIKTLLNEEDLYIRHVRQQELMLRRMDSSAARRGHPVEKQVIVFNMKGLSYALDKMALRVFSRTISTDQQFYPERLETLFIINSPWFFKTVWALISPWIDVVTASKIKIVGEDFLDHLREVIDDDQIPSEWGGSRENFPWTYPANYSEATGTDITGSAGGDANSSQEAAVREEEELLARAAAAAAGGAEDSEVVMVVPPASIDQQLENDEVSSVDA